MAQSTSLFCTFGSDEAGNTLHILRFVIEGERLARSSESEPIILEHSDQAKVQAGAAGSMLLIGTAI